MFGLFMRARSGLPCRRVLLGGGLLSARFRSVGREPALRRGRLKIEVLTACVEAAEFRRLQILRDPLALSVSAATAFQ